MVKFSQDLFDTICERIAGGESLRKIASGPEMPSQAAVFKWLAAEGNEALVEQYARAREAQADTLFDEILDIADDGRNDWVKDQDGSERYNGDHVQRSRLRIDSRKWMAGKLRPKKYGGRTCARSSRDSPCSWAAGRTCARAA